MEYCIALANERGGKLVPGVTDKHPRRVVGSSAFPSIPKITAAIHESLRMRVRKSGNGHLRALDAQHLLSDAGLVVERGITIAALVLLGSERAMRRHLSQAEVIFEWRQREAILNAVTHRDYRAAGSIFVRQFGERIEIESPGGGVSALPRKSRG